MRKSPITCSDCNLLEGDNAAENTVLTKKPYPLLVLCEVPRNLAWAIASRRNPSVGPVVDDSSLHSRVDRKVVSGRSTCKGAACFFVIERDVQLEVARTGGIAYVNQQI